MEFRKETQQQSCGDEGMDADDQVRHRAAKAEKSRLQAELAELKSRTAVKRGPISEAEVLDLLKDSDSLLEAADSGELGHDGKQRAAALIRDLVGGVIDVSFIRLQGKRGYGVGRFIPNPVSALFGRDAIDRDVVLDLPEITVPFRKLPRNARIADEAYRLRTEEGLSYTEIGRRLECGSGNAWAAYTYWHTSRGLPTPYQRDAVKARHETSA